MNKRIIKVFKELNISSYKVAEDLNQVVSQVTIRNFVNGKTENPHQTTLDLLVDYLCNNFKVSREWLMSGNGDIYLKEESDFYIEKLGVRFELDELIKHFEENKHAYFLKSKNLMLHVIEEFILNNEKYFEMSEYLRLFINDKVERKLEARLNELKDLGVIVKATKKDN
ncbi:helix-turn-helix domain-containing protein [Kordia jejudonensis]|uniref:helix-turn-helix domain-containing protein n=1 Tax=Kordia jejudonensis TaxID=1348245 RepID=UPI00062933E5|nr:helix-turn-helix transcriptional regulator [Kordia jejudonensis]